MKKWKKISSQIAFDNPWMRIRQDTVKLPNGQILDDYFLWLEPDVSIVVPVTKNRKIILVEQYKHGIGKFMTEYPAGFVDKGETPPQSAARELKEETGYQSPQMELIGTLSHNPTKSIGKAYIFLAQNATQVCDPKEDGLSDDNEDIEVVKLSSKQLLNLVNSGKIWAADSVAATYIAAKKLSWL